jgi:hypothetical protein
VNKEMTIARMQQERDAALERANAAESLLIGANDRIAQLMRHAETIERDLAAARERTVVAEASTESAKLTPIDIMLGSARKFYAEENYKDANLAAARVASYIHQRFAPTQEPAKRHAEQELQDDLFNPRPAPAPPPTAPEDDDPWSKLLIH